MLAKIDIVKKETDGSDSHQLCKVSWMFSVAIHVCRHFFLGNVSPPPDVEALIRKHVSPVRPGRSRPRKMTAKQRGLASLTE